MSVPRRLRLGAAVFVLSVLAACSSNGSPKHGSSATAPSSPSSASDFFESFDNNDNGWPIRSDSDGTSLAVMDGEYRITLPAGEVRYIWPGALAHRKDLQNGVSVTGTIRVLSGSNYSIGLACRMAAADRQYYVGRIFGDGTSAIVRREKGKEERILRSSRANPVKLQQGQAIQLALLCGEKDGKMSLSLSINGQLAAQADDPAPLPENPAGIYAVAGLHSVTSSFAFDDIRVSKYTP